jgi:hypothetical protein
MSADVERANQMRWQFQRGHYEVWYASLTHAPTRTGFWIRYTLESPCDGQGAPYAQLWFARFDARDPERTFGLNRRYAIDELRHTASPFSLTLGPAELRDGLLRGQLAGAADEGAAHEIAWDLAFPPAARVHLWLPRALYQVSLTESLVLSPHLDVAARGEITVDGERYVLDGAPLGQSHIWGRKHLYSWAWAHCNAFEGAPGAALEALTARVRRGPLVLPKATLLTLYLDGEELRFTEPWAPLATRADYATGRYALTAVGPRARIEAELTCRADDMILAEYVDPDGDPAYCHNTGVADARVILYRRSPFVGRFREHRRLTADRGAHFEWGARAGDPHVRRRHAEIAPREWPRHSP